MRLTGTSLRSMAQPAPPMIHAPASMTPRALLLGLALATASAPALSADRTRYNGFDVTNAALPLHAIERGGPPRDGIPAIDRPRFVDAPRAGLDDVDRVLGLQLNGEARAYPVRILNWHEVVNDRFGARWVAITYCPLCGTGVAFATPASMAGRGFGISGLLYNSDVLLYDRTTESLWSQMMGEAISGPLKGTRLASLPITHTSWADWRRRHPTSLVLSTDTGFDRDYARDPYAGYGRVAQLMFEVQHRDTRFHAKEWVLGVEVAGVHKAYPFSVLAGQVDARGELLDQVGGRALHIRHDAVHGTADAFDTDGQPWPSTMAYWFAWFAFHPRTEVLRGR